MKNDCNEPACCFDASAYVPAPDCAPCDGSIDVPRVIAGLDELLDCGDEKGAQSLLDFWRGKAAACGDWRAELSFQSELMGFHRRTMDEKSAMAAVERGLEIINGHGLRETVSGATVLLNAATTKAAFGCAAESIPMFVAASRVLSQHLDPTDYRFGGLYNNMALSYAAVGERERAEQYFFKAMSVIGHCDAPENELAVTWCNLAELYDGAGEEEKSAAACERAWECLDSESLRRDGYYAFTASKCAPTLDRLGFFVYSAELKKRVRDIYEGT